MSTDERGSGWDQATESVKGARVLSFLAEFGQNEERAGRDGSGGQADVARDVNDVVHFQEGVTHMSVSIDGSAIDKVLQDAVDSGGVRSVTFAAPIRSRDPSGSALRI